MLKNFSKFLAPEENARFKDLASAWQSIFTILAIIGAGIWALYTFLNLQQVDIAHGQLKKMELEALREARFDISMEISIQKTEMAAPLIVGELRAKNIGTTNATIFIDKNSINLYKVTYDAKGNEFWKPSLVLNIKETEKSGVSSILGEIGATKSRRFSTTPIEGGVYVVSADFKARADTGHEQQYHVQSNYLLVAPPLRGSQQGLPQTRQAK
jgi:hypothetical protein